MKQKEKLLKQVFNDNRSEWANENFDKLFVEPTYHSKLKAIRPCVLVGGRGTGKTTSLHSLKYDSTYERLCSKGLDFSDQDYLGVLVRMNKNRVKAFKGKHFCQEDWRKLFAHFFNLIVCKELVELTEWLQNKLDIKLSDNAIDDIANDLALGDCSTLPELKRLIKRGISKLQIYVNNGDELDRVSLSMQESPLRTFAESLKEEGLLSHRTIFCCIDEYENLTDDQQAVLNTYIKHSERPLSFKVGVRKNGLRNRQTLDGEDLLKVPDDYAEIEIVDEGFEFFANEVGKLRLEFLQQNGLNIPTSLDVFLEELTNAEEAKLLGSEKVAQKTLKALDNISEDIKTFLSTKNAFEITFLKYWHDKNSDISLAEHAQDWYENEVSWNNKLNNHGFSSLFWLSKGQKGLRVKKYYCGKRVFLAMSGGNIRYFLELIDGAISFQYPDGKFDENQNIIIKAINQTYASKEVGKRRLNQLEELADNGVELKRLVLAIGKVFFEYARNPEDKAPETNSFTLTGLEQDKSELVELLMEGVGHLAFEAEPLTKATSNSDFKENEYRLHRIFSSFFEISHRKKRRTTFDSSELIQVLKGSPKSAISKLINSSAEPSKLEKPKLATKKVESELSQQALEELPEQLAFFSSFFDGEE